MNCIDLLKDLIVIESTDKVISNDAIEYCNAYLKTYGITSTIIENNGYKSLICEIGSGNKTLIFNGHLDVVSCKKEQFAPYEKDGRLYGRGSADMKAGVAAMMTALIELKDENLPCRVQLQLVTDEEIGGANCSEFIVEQGYLGDFVICGEPTNLGIGVQAKGILQIDIEVFGKSAHGSRPWEGDNALIKALEVFKNITALPFAKEKSEIYDCPSINLSKLAGGDAYNKVPDHCEMSLDIRFLPEQDHNEILSQIKTVAGENVKIHGYGYPVKTKVNNPYVKLLSGVTEKYINTETRIFGQHGSADTRFYSKCNIPAVEFGPIGANWHGDEEYVDIASVCTYKEILKNFAMNFK